MFVHVHKNYSFPHLHVGFRRGDEDNAQEGAGLPGDGSRGDQGGGEGGTGHTED